MTVFKGMRFVGGFTFGTCAEMCKCLSFRVNFERNLAVISGSVIMPYETASLLALPTAPVLAEMAALVVFEKVVIEGGWR